MNEVDFKIRSSSQAAVNYLCSISCKGKKETGKIFITLHGNVRSLSVYHTEGTTLQEQRINLAAAEQFVSKTDFPDSMKGVLVRFEVVHYHPLTQAYHKLELNPYPVQAPSEKVILKKNATFLNLAIRIADRVKNFEKHHINEDLLAKETFKNKLIEAFTELYNNHEIETSESLDDVVTELVNDELARLNQDTDSPHVDFVSDTYIEGIVKNYKRDAIDLGKVEIKLKNKAHQLYPQADEKKTSDFAKKMTLELEEDLKKENVDPPDLLKSPLIQKIVRNHKDLLQDSSQTLSPLGDAPSEPTTEEDESISNPLLPKKRLSSPNLSEALSDEESEVSKQDPKESSEESSPSKEEQVSEHSSSPVPLLQEEGEKVPPILEKKPFVIKRLFLTFFSSRNPFLRCFRFLKKH